VSVVAGERAGAGLPAMAHLQVAQRRHATGRDPLPNPPRPGRRVGIQVLREHAPERRKPACSGGVWVPASMCATIHCSNRSTSANNCASADDRKPAISGRGNTSNWRTVTKRGDSYPTGVSVRKLVRSRQSIDDVNVARWDAIEAQLRASAEQTGRLLGSCDDRHVRPRPVRRTLLLIG
jgi:hypothetical protein